MFCETTAMHGKCSGRGAAESVLFALGSLSGLMIQRPVFVGDVCCGN